MARLDRKGHRGDGPLRFGDCYAKENGFIQIEAIANELAGRFWLTLGKEDFSRLYLVRAYKNYEVWGAKRKLLDLEERYSHLLDQLPKVSRSAGDGSGFRPTASSDSIASDQLDLSMVIEALQAISGQTTLSDLLARLMEMVIKNAGAERGVLILEQEGRFSWPLEFPAMASFCWIPFPWTSTWIYRMVIVQYAMRTLEKVVLSNAAEEGVFTNDEYVLRTRPKSILCIPLMNLGKRSGALYLENNQLAGAFTVGRVKLLEVIAAHAAITVENVRYFAKTQEHEGFLNAIVENIPDMIFVKDAKELRFIGFNRAGEDSWGTREKT